LAGVPLANTLAKLIISQCVESKTSGTGMAVVFLYKILLSNTRSFKTYSCDVE